ncbi:MAG: DUF2914 domain-containing protein [Rhodothermales bacterium]
MNWFTLLMALTALAISPARVRAQDGQVVVVESIRFGTGIEDRELVGTGTTFTSRPDMIYCHTRIEGARPPTHVYHIWSFNGEEKRRVKLEVGAASWRTWSGRSTEALLAQGEGIWEVEVQSSEGEVLKRATFTIRRADG